MRKRNLVKMPRRGFTHILLKNLPQIFTMTLLYLFLLTLGVGANVSSRPESLNLTYSEVELLTNNSCPKLDSCNHRRYSGSRGLDSTKERNCACDYMCAEFDDCCIDARSFPESTTTNPASAWKCLELRQFGGVYMKDTCGPHLNYEAELKELCENKNSDDFSDPLGSMPATDAITGMTFKNYYCGLCNGFRGNLVLWTPRLECPTLTIYNNSRKNLTHEYVFRNLVYHHSWGLYLDGDDGSLFFHDCEIDPVMPRLLESKIRLCKTQSVSRCPNDWEDEDVRTKCASYTGIRYLHGESYRNIHCALCNRVNLTLLSCQSVEYRHVIFRTFEHHSFSLLLDINERLGQNVGRVKKCDKGEVFDPFYKICRSLTCLPNHTRQGDKCVPAHKPETITPKLVERKHYPLLPVISSGNNTNLLETDQNERNASYIVDSGEYMSMNGTDAFIETEGKISSFDFDNLTGISYNVSMMDANNELQNEINKFKNCLLISLTSEDYIIFNNKSIYVPKYDKFYEPTSYFATDGSVLVCSHLTMEEDIKFNPIMGYVTVVGLGISMLCLLLHFLAFCLVPDLQNLSGKNLVSQSISLFFAYCCFIIGQLNRLDVPSCTAVAFLTFFFFQVSFFWMSIMAYDVWRTLKMATTELRVTTGKQWKRFALYSFYSWFTPLFIVTIAAMAEYTDLFPEEYRPRFAQPTCWFNHRRALLIFFAVPLFVIMLANVILFVSSARMIIMTTKTTVKQQSQSQKRNFKLYLRLALLMGLTWAMGLIAGYADIEFMWYLFVIFNTLQGLFIFVAFSCSDKVFSYLRDSFAKFTKAADFRSSTVHSATGSGCNTNSTTLLPNGSKKSTSKLFVNAKHSASPTNSTASNSSRPDAAYY